MVKLDIGRSYIGYYHHFGGKDVNYYYCYVANGQKVFCLQGKSSFSRWGSANLQGSDKPY